MRAAVSLPSFEAGHEYGATGRSLLLFILTPQEDATDDVARSFRHVMAEFHRAVLDKVKLPT